MEEPLNELADQSPADTPTGSTFPVVGIGSSVISGLATLQRLLSRLDAALGTAYVVVPHANPGRPGELVQLLQNHPALPVSLADDGMAIEANRIYVVPADVLFRLSGERFALCPPDSRVIPCRQEV